MAELDMTAICQSFFYPQNYQPGWPPSTRVSLQCAAQAVGAALCQFFFTPKSPTLAVSWSSKLSTSPATNNQSCIVYPKILIIKIEHYL